MSSSRAHDTDFDRDVHDTIGALAQVLHKMTENSLFGRQAILQRNMRLVRRSNDPAMTAIVAATVPQLGCLGGDGLSYLISLIGTIRTPGQKNKVS